MDIMTETNSKGSLNFFNVNSVSTEPIIVGINKKVLYTCDIFGDKSTLTLHFHTKESVPNLFHRICQRLILGFVWKKL